MTTDELRDLIVKGIDSTLEAPWVIRRWLTTENVRVLRATRRYWLADDGTQLNALLALVQSEPSHSPGDSAMPKHTMTAAQSQQMASALGIDLTKIDWQRVIQIIMLILQALQQGTSPRSAVQAAGCDPAQEDTCCCCVECACANIDTALRLIEHAETCCHPVTPPTP